MDNFTPWASLIGGLIIGAASVGMLVLQGRIAGISGIAGGLLAPAPGDIGWRAAFVGGLLAGGVTLGLLRPDWFVDTTDTTYAMVAVAGLLVGFGTRLGSGCTSGHGVCGIGRLAPRSIAATLTFITTGALAVLAVRLLGGAS